MRAQNAAKPFVGWTYVCIAQRFFKTLKRASLLSLLFSVQPQRSTPVALMLLLIFEKFHSYTVYLWHRPRPIYRAFVPLP